VRADLEAEFEEFVTAASPRLFRAAYAISRDHHHAEDAVQAALAKAYVRWRRIARTERPEAYVRRMVVNEVLSWRRRASSGELPSGALPEPAAAAPAESLAESDAMWSAIGLLPARQRAVLVLRYYEQLSEAEIAETLGIRPGTVKSQCSAALANLRRSWDRMTVEGERV